MIAFGTIIAVSTIVGAIGVLMTSVVHVPTGEMTGSLALRALLEIAVAGTLVQISLASCAFVWEKYRQRRMVARHSNKPLRADSAGCGGILGTTCGNATDPGAPDRPA